uniref:Uncharacterized protein n=1 Tax=Arundo donax TaxID=35708 RepID=A0A0A9TPY5_ARUDO
MITYDFNDLSPQFSSRMVVRLKLDSFTVHVWGSNAST